MELGVECLIHSTSEKSKLTICIDLSDKTSHMDWEQYFVCEDCTVEFLFQSNNQIIIMTSFMK